MNELAAYKLFMRWKFKKALLANFDLMIVLATNQLFMRSKFANNAFFNLDLMKNAAIRRSNDYKEF
jgi:hypothetical protein